MKSKFKLLISSNHNILTKSLYSNRPPFTKWIFSLQHVNFPCPCSSASLCSFNLHRRLLAGVGKLRKRVFLFSFISPPILSISSTNQHSPLQKIQKNKLI